MFEKILNSRAKTITFAAFLVALSTLLSGFLGILKMRLLAGNFELIILDSFFAAFRLPDLISGILITGGIVASFLPLFSNYYHKNQKEAWSLTNNVISITFVVLSFLCFLIWIFAPQLISFIVPGFSQEQKNLTISLTRIMFLSPLIFGISGIFSGVLQYFDRFLIYSLAPILYNIGIIFGILVLAPVFFSNNEIYGVAWGVILGALMHLLIQIPSAIKCGYRFKLIFNIKDQGIYQIGKLIIPRTIGQTSSQINLIIVTIIASFLASGSVAIFNFANNLYLFPVAIIGVSFAVAAFPNFSKSLANGERKVFFNSFSATFRQIILVMLPVSFMVFILRAQIVRLVLGADGFGWEETRLTAASLGAFSFAILFSSLIPLIVRAFFSMQDTKTPAMISIMSVFLNIILSFYFIYLFNKTEFIFSIFKLDGISDIRIVALPLAISISTMFQFFLLMFFLKKRMPDIPFFSILNSFWKIFFASFVMSFFSYFSLRIALFFVDLTTFWAVFFQASFSFSIGLFIYLLILHLLGLNELKSMHCLIKKKLLRMKI